MRLLLATLVLFVFTGVAHADDVKVKVRQHGVHVQVQTPAVTFYRLHLYVPPKPNFKTPIRDKIWYNKVRRNYYVTRPAVRTSVTVNVR